MRLHIPAKVLIHMWSYNFYDMTLSTGKQRRHMIRLFILQGKKINISKSFSVEKRDMLLQILSHS